MSGAELDDYPRGIFHTDDLDTTPKDIGVADEEIRVKSVLMRGGGAERVVQWRSSDGTVVYFRIEIGANEIIRLGPFRIRPTVGSVKGGLEIVSSATGDNLRVTVFFHATKYIP